MTDTESPPDELTRRRKLLYLRARMVCRRYDDHRLHGTERTADRYEMAVTLLAEAYAAVRELTDAGVSSEDAA